MPIVYAAFFRKQTIGPAPTADEPGTEAPLMVLLAIAVTATGTVALFFFPDTVLELAMQTAGAGK